MNTLTRFCLALSLVLAGCSGADDPKPAEHSSIVVHKVCKKTLCQSLKAQGKDMCSECMDSCLYLAPYGYSSDCNDTCDFACTPDQCDNETCVSYEYRFEVVGEYDPRVFDACQRAVAHSEQCGQKFGPRFCEAAARTRIPEAAAAYDCAAAEACSGDDSHCFPPPAPIGERWNVAVAKKCPALVFDSASTQSLDAFASVLRADAQEALRACYDDQAECASKADCFNAWAAAVSPSE